ncbi:hypothetical protein JCM16303_002101 [Sporobolomyces ruberrimus]
MLHVGVTRSIWNRALEEDQLLVMRALTQVVQSTNAGREDTSDIYVASFPSAEKLRMQLKVEAFGTEEESWLSKQAYTALKSKTRSSLGHLIDHNVSADNLSDWMERAIFALDAAQGDSDILELIDQLVGLARNCHKELKDGHGPDRKERIVTAALMALNALFRRALDIKPERRNRAGEPQEPVKAGVPGPAGVPTLRLSRFLPTASKFVELCGIPPAETRRLLVGITSPHPRHPLPPANLAVISAQLNPHAPHARDELPEERARDRIAVLRNKLNDNYAEKLPGQAKYVRDRLERIMQTLDEGDIADYREVIWLLTYLTEPKQLESPLDFAKIPENFKKLDGLFTHSQLHSKRGACLPPDFTYNPRS